MKATTRTEPRLFVSTPTLRRPPASPLRQYLAPGFRSRQPLRIKWRVHASLEAEAQNEDTEVEDDTEEEYEDEEFDEDVEKEMNELFRDRRSEIESYDFEEQVIDLRRVTKVVKGGRRLRFRAAMVVGDGEGTVGVGNASAKEIPDACRKASLSAKRNLVTVPLNKYTRSFPNFQEAKFGAAKVVLRPAKQGTGVIAGGAVRVVLEVAGVRNGYGKILNSTNHMNIAKATVKALSMMRTIKQVVQQRGVTMDYLLGKSIDLKDSACPPEGTTRTPPQKYSRSNEDEDEVYALDVLDDEQGDDLNN